MNIVGIDPGFTFTSLVVWDGAAILNRLCLSHPYTRDFLRDLNPQSSTVAIEMVSSYGMPVGREVFETVLATGRYLQVAADIDLPVLLPTRREICLHLCRQMAGDAGVRWALIERFGGKGTKRAPGITHGLHADLWQAFAVAVWAADVITDGRRHPEPLLP